MGRGGDINARDAEGFTLLMDAAFYGQTKIVKYLIKLGANVNAVQLEGTETALKLAARAFAWQSVEALLAAGADITANYGEGNALMATALKYAIGKEECRRTKTIQVLHSAGAFLHTSEEDFKTMMDWAKKINDQEFIQLLEKYRNT